MVSDLMICEACQTEITTDTCPKCGLKQKKTACKDCFKKFYKDYLNDGLCPICFEKEKTAPYKEPLIALLLSIIPGGGQYYLGQKNKGGFYLGMFFICCIVPVIGWFLLPAAFGVPAGDAYRTAKRMNRMDEE